MVHINLLPVREIKRRAAAKQQITIFIIVVLCILALLGFIGFQQSSEAKGLQQELAKVQQEKKRYTKILNQIQKLEKDKALLEKRIGIIGKLKADSSLTVHVLDEVANITPTKRMWLTSLSQSGQSLNLTGMALDNRTIAKYMEDLKQSPYVVNVNLANSSLKAFSGRNLKSFALSCAVSVPAQKGEKK